MTLQYLSNEEIGHIIKVKREKLSMTQAQLGEKLGVGAAAVNKWEVGRVMNIKRSILRDLSIVLKIHPAHLIGLKVDSTDIVVSDVEFSHEEIYEIKNYLDFVKSKRK